MLPLLKYYSESKLFLPLYDACRSVISFSLGKEGGRPEGDKVKGWFRRLKNEEINMKH